MLLSSGGKFLSAKNVKNGDVLTFKDEGVLVLGKFIHAETFSNGKPNPKAGTPREELRFNVSVNGEDYIFTCGKTNQEIMKEAFGWETKEWVGKKATIAVIKVNVGGNLKDSVMLTPILKADAKTEVHPDIDEVEWEA
jgi:hypothetical protein